MRFSSNFFLFSFLNSLAQTSGNVTALKAIYYDEADVRQEDDSSENTNPSIIYTNEIQTFL